MTNNETDSVIEPIILEIYLNNKKYKDRLLINDLKRKAHLIRIDEYIDNSFYVKTEDLEEILYSKYRKEILNFDTTPTSSIVENANSIFYIENMMREFRHLKYFKINISESHNPSKNENVKFEYKIKHSKIDIANRVESGFYSTCKRIFKNIGIYNPTYYNPTPYIEISVFDLFQKLYKYSSNLDREDEEYFNVRNIFDMFGEKLEKDDATILIIMEK
jgi:hypothetical protein